MTEGSSLRAGRSLSRIRQSDSDGMSTRLHEAQGLGGLNNIGRFDAPLLDTAFIQTLLPRLH
jgi:hypothetical protein